MSRHFQDCIDKTKFFDRNGLPRHEDAAAITLVHTADGYFGDRWHAVTGPGGYRIGDDKDMGKALLWGMTTVISDAAAAADIKLERGGLGADNRRYAQRVLINGELRGWFNPISLGNEYDLFDIEGRRVVVYPGARGADHFARCSTKADMDACARRWFEFIPTDDDLAARKQAEADEKARKEAKADEEDRIWKIEQAGPELLAALEQWAEFMENNFTPDEISFWHETRAAIEKAHKG